LRDHAKEARASHSPRRRIRSSSSGGCSTITGTARAASRTASWSRLYEPTGQPAAARVDRLDQAHRGRQLVGHHGRRAAEHEYFWEPVPGGWNVRPRGTGSAPIEAGSGEMTVDFAPDEPQPAPVTSIAWRIAHLMVGVFGMRVASHFGGPPIDYPSFDYAATADQALTQLDDGYAAWVAGVRSLGRRAWTGRADRPCGPAEGPYAEHPMSALVLHINREALHHGAELALLRDLYRARPID
jgi:hypothetical protein